MMLSLMEYYEQHLKGKSAEEIKTCIRRLKREINHCKKMVEIPDDLNDFMYINISDITEARLCLEMAIQTLEKLGVPYEYTKCELKSIKLNERLFSLTKLKFSIGYGIDNVDEYEFCVKDEMIEKYENNNQCDFDLPKETFVDVLQSLYLEEWPHNNQNNNPDAFRWTMRIYFDDEPKCVTFRGVENYPYNFGQLLKLLSISFEKEVELQYSVDTAFIDDLINRVYTKIKELPAGTRICTAELLDLVTEQHQYVYGDFVYDGVTLTTMDLFNIDYYIKTKARDHGINIDYSIEEYTILVMPFNVKFLIE